MTGRKARLGVLLSGRGSNFLAIASAIAEGSLTGCEIAVVISNIADAPGLRAAAELDLPAAAQVSRGVARESHDLAMVQLLQQHGVDYVILAGYLRVLTPAFLQAFPQRVLNIHPALLPSFPGLHAQKQALDYGAKVAGCTVHFVDEEVDHGMIIVQRTVGILDSDDEISLSARIIAEEHEAYPEAIRRVLSGEYEIRGRRYVRRSGSSGPVQS